MTMTVATLALSALATMGPRHTHDCECCKFLGRVDVEGSPPEDVYVCETDGRTDPCLVRRDGSDGPEYTSFPVSVARMAAEMPNSVEWRLALMAYDAWVEAGRPR